MQTSAVQDYSQWLAAQSDAPLWSFLGAAVPPAEERVRLSTIYSAPSPKTRRTVVRAMLQGLAPPFVAAQVAVVNVRARGDVRRWLVDISHSPFAHRPELVAALARSRTAAVLRLPDVLDHLTARAHTLWQVDLLAHLGSPRPGLMTAAAFAGPDETQPDRVAAVQRLMAAGARVRDEPVLRAALLGDPVRHSPMGRALLAAAVEEWAAAGLPADAPLLPQCPRHTLLEVAVDLRCYDLAEALVARGADPWRRTMRDPHPAAQTLLGYALSQAAIDDHAALLALGGDAATAWLREHSDLVTENHNRDGAGTLEMRA
jgi:hypothetical protein